MKPWADIRGTRGRFGISAPTPLIAGSRLPRFALCCEAGVFKTHPFRDEHFFEQLKMCVDFTREIGLVLDSYGLLAVALMRRSAAAELGLEPGDEVTLSAASEGRDAGITVPVALRGPDRPHG